MNVETQVDTLIESVKKDSNLHQGSSICRTMVFANTVEAVEAVANILERAGIECYRYHKDSSLEQRAETIVNFRDKGGIFVCTDAAARGLDVPNISHVIQVSVLSHESIFLKRNIYIVFAELNIFNFYCRQILLHQLWISCIG